MGLKFINKFKPKLPENFKYWIYCTYVYIYVFLYLYYICLYIQFILVVFPPCCVFFPFHIQWVFHSLVEKHRQLTDLEYKPLISKANYSCHCLHIRKTGLICCLQRTLQINNISITSIYSGRFLFAVNHRCINQLSAPLESLQGQQNTYLM